MTEATAKDVAERLEAMKTRAVQVADLTDAELAAIVDSRMDPRHAGLDALLSE